MTNVNFDFILGKYFLVKFKHLAEDIWLKNMVKEKVSNWGLKEGQSFEFQYPDNEIVLMKEGTAKVTFEDGTFIILTPGEFIVFFKDVKVTWYAITDFNKDYMFQTYVDVE